MTAYRPPLGGLFRLSGPSTAGEGRQEAARASRADEARDAIRHFVRVLERLDRQVAGRTAARRAGTKPGSKRR